MPDFTVNWSPTSTLSKLLPDLSGREGLKFLEIGALEGQGTRFFFERFLGKTGTMVCIDPFIAYSKSTIAKIEGFDHVINASLLERFKSNVAPFLDRIDLRQGLSQDVLPTLPAETFDLSFVDGDHSRAAVVVDGAESFRLVKKGGYIVFDDYRWGYEKNPAASPKDAVDQFLRLYRGRIKLIHQDWCVIVRKEA